MDNSNRLIIKWQKSNPMHPHTLFLDQCTHDVSGHRFTSCHGWWVHLSIETCITSELYMLSTTCTVHPHIFITSIQDRNVGET